MMRTLNKSLRIFFNKSRDVLFDFQCKRYICSLFFIDEGQSAFAAVSAILVSGHEDSSAAGLGRAFASQAVNFPVLVDLKLN